MKKVLFTALAVVLFSGVSMASTKEIKIEKVKIFKKLDACTMAGLGAAGACQDNGGTPAQCLAAANAAKDACEKAK